MVEAGEVEELTRDRCWALLRTVEVGRLAVARGDQPDIFPVNFVVYQATIIFRTAVGAKLTAATEGRPVAFEADGYDVRSNEAWSVVIKGMAHEMARLPEVAAPDVPPLVSWSASHKGRYVRIEPDEVTGRRFPVSARAIAGPVRDQQARRGR